MRFTSLGHDDKSIARRIVSSPTRPAHARTHNTNCSRARPPASTHARSPLSRPPPRAAPPPLLLLLCPRAARQQSRAAILWAFTGSVLAPGPRNTPQPALPQPLLCKYCEPPRRVSHSPGALHHLFVPILLSRTPRALLPDPLASACSKQPPPNHRQRFRKSAFPNRCQVRSRRHRAAPPPESCLATFICHWWRRCRCLHARLRFDACISALRRPVAFTITHTRGHHR